MALQVTLLPLELVRLLRALSLGPAESDPVFPSCRVCRLTGPRLARPVEIDHVAQRLTSPYSAGFLRAGDR